MSASHRFYHPPASQTLATYSQATTSVFVLLLAFYVTVVRLLRYHRSHKNTTLLNNVPEKEDHVSSVRRAQVIYRTLMNSEFPFIFVKGVELALFRTYAIPTISSLLDKTTLLTSKSSIALRYSNTWALFNEFALADWGSDRWVEAMARTRAIHATLRKSGKVREEDMLYTLAALATQPVRLINAWEWRQVTDAELCATGTLYRALAEVFDIDWRKYFADTTQEDKASYEASIGGQVSIDWDLRDSNSPYSGLDFYHALFAWQQSYENRAMRHIPANHNLASAAVDLLLWGVPGNFLKRVVTKILVVLMDDPLRIAVGYLEPATISRIFTRTVLISRKLTLRYLTLPRLVAVQPTRVLASDVSHPQPSSLEGAIPQHQSRTILTSYVGAPYYVKPTLWNRWGPGAWWWWCLGHPIPTQGIQHFVPEGYLIHEIGSRRGKTTTVQAREEQAVRALLHSF
ncbi:hypothetical protein GGR52DRAFT_563795 [Hypoxylon sp. FL1284]|nr:hypothetical protein GGR52DRAFT_563795 [Hypoxylon sp. FL1284]